MRDQPGFFDVDDRLKRLSDLGDQLEAFRAAVDFEMFRPDLDAALAYSDGAQGGRPPFDPVMMFKVLVIQTTNNLSDERAEFLINDRLSFMRFLGLGLSDRIPDARTIWLFREKLTKAGAIGPLFERFDTTLRQSGYIAMSGQIVDASLIAAPRQRNTNEEKAAIKAGRVPDNWKDKPAKLRQKDQDARWTVKFTKAKPREDGSTPPVDLAIPVFGYQNHISIDRGFGFIRKWSATDAAAYEGRRLREGLLCERSLGGHGLSLESQRRVHGKERLRQPCPSQEAEGSLHAGGSLAGEQRQIKSQIEGRACLRRAEGPDGLVHPHRRDCAGNGENRTGEPRL
jgi:transposase, IS5 family